MLCLSVLNVSESLERGPEDHRGSNSLLIFTAKGGVGSGIYFPPLPQKPLLSLIPFLKK